MNIPKGATNGDIINALFPNAKDIRVDDGYPLNYIIEGEWHRNLKEWWDAPYNAYESLSEWIPVSYRMPEADGKYLVYISSKYSNYIMTCEYYHGHWYPDDETASDNVIAWMPLPEPYKESEVQP